MHVPVMTAEMAHEIQSTYSIESSYAFKQYDMNMSSPKSCCYQTCYGMHTQPLLSVQAIKKGQSLIDQTILLVLVLWKYTWYWEFNSILHSTTTIWISSPIHSITTRWLSSWTSYGGHTLMQMQVMQSWVGFSLLKSLLNDVTIDTFTLWMQLLYPSHTCAGYDTVIATPCYN